MEVNLIQLNDIKNGKSKAVGLGQDYATPNVFYKSLDTYSRWVNKEGLLPGSQREKGLLRGYEMRRMQEMRRSQPGAMEEHFASDGELRELASGSS